MPPLMFAPTLGLGYTSRIAHRTSAAPPHVRVRHRLPQYLVVGLRSAGGLGIVVGVKITTCYLFDTTDRNPVAKIGE